MASRSGFPQWSSSIRGRGSDAIAPGGTVLGS